MFPAQETNIRGVFGSYSHQYRKTFGKCRKVSGRKEHTYYSPPGNNPCAFGRRTCGPFPSSACARGSTCTCMRSGARACRCACAYKRLPPALPSPPPTPAHALCSAVSSPRAQSPGWLRGTHGVFCFPGPFCRDMVASPLVVIISQQSPRRPPRASGPHHDSHLLRLPGAKGKDVGSPGTG